ncbi:hypothetical protein FXV77_05200 [Sphingobacterium phlebotomi]|uniref:Uncharacterized protein n=1 Tax=Sphingobacterium phlebotomi TaxID=2605433 RepID=A0A5D4H9X8_9SPHI|nr:hypothetical protein [Sphingobacterium phlebotomi]TYR37404.1 hypothetical protein FXV77_05200 [Sphingobacterium phlebotomi]
MDYRLKTRERLPTLMDTLSAWNETENMFTQVFGENALEDRDFKKMKLREYDKIWHKYNGKVQTKDDRALMVMLRFQCKKLRKTLYRGLLPRLLSRISSYVRHLFSDSVSTVPKALSDAYRYAKSPLNVDPSSSERQSQSKSVHQKYKHNGQHLGRRKEQNRKRGNGTRI